MHHYQTHQLHNNSFTTHQDTNKNLIVMSPKSSYHQSRLSSLEINKFWPVRREIARPAVAAAGFVDLGWAWQGACRGWRSRSQDDARHGPVAYSRIGKARDGRTILDGYGGCACGWIQNFREDVGWG